MATQIPAGYLWKYMDTYGRIWWVWSSGFSNFYKSFLWSHTITYKSVWIGMITYGYSDFCKLLMVAYRYILICMDRYGHPWLLWFSQTTYGSKKIYTNTYGWVLFWAIHGWPGFAVGPEQYGHVWVRIVACIVGIYGPFHVQYSSVISSSIWLAARESAYAM